MHSLLVHRRGHIATELYWWPYAADRPRLMHSVAKSFTACAVGMAIAEGRWAAASVDRYLMGTTELPAPLQAGALAVARVVLADLKAEPPAA